MNKGTILIDEYDIPHIVINDKEAIRVNIDYMDISKVQLLDTSRYRQSSQTLDDIIRNLGILNEFINKVITTVKEEFDDTKEG